MTLFGYSLIHYSSVAYILAGKSKRLSTLGRVFSRIFLGLGRNVPNFIVYSIAGDIFPSRWNRTILKLKEQYRSLEGTRDEIFENRVIETTTSELQPKTIKKNYSPKMARHL